MRYFFTVTAGRSGQNSFADLLTQHVPDAYVAFEEPNPKKLYLKQFSGFLGGWESRFRRRFIETHELLGRGKVLKAFDKDDEKYLDAIVAKRLTLIGNKNAGIYIDVSKYFARGLHRAFARAVGEFGLILLVRDPLLNMRSFLNRNKNFTLDNNMPDARSNLLRLDSSEMSKGELYLWAWCEMCLRYRRLIEEFNVQRHTIIRTEELQLPDMMNAHLERLGLPYNPCSNGRILNTNKRETVVVEEDILTYERFLARLPGEAVEKISYLHDYRPRERHRLAS